MRLFKVHSLITFLNLCISFATSFFIWLMVTVGKSQLERWNWKICFSEWVLVKFTLGMITAYTLCMWTLSWWTALSPFLNFYWSIQNNVLVFVCAYVLNKVLWCLFQFLAIISPCHNHVILVVHNINHVPVCAVVKQKENFKKERKKNQETLLLNFALNYLKCLIYALLVFPKWKQHCYVLLKY